MQSILWAYSVCKASLPTRCLGKLRILREDRSLPPPPPLHGKFPDVKRQELKRTLQPLCTASAEMGQVRRKFACFAVAFSDDIVRSAQKISSARSVLGNLHRSYGGLKIGESSFFALVIAHTCVPTDAGIEDARSGHATHLCARSQVEISN